MFAMPGLRTFSISADRDRRSVSCSPEGVFVGNVPLLERADAGRAFRHWTVRPIVQLNNELTALFGLPINIAAKANALALIANAFNSGDFAIAAIATVQMRIPAPPSPAEAWASPDEIVRRERELARSGLLKFWGSRKAPASRRAAKSRLVRASGGGRRSRTSGASGNGWRPLGQASHGGRGWRRGRRVSPLTTRAPVSARDAGIIGR